METKPQRPARAPIAGLGLHNENLPHPTRTINPKAIDAAPIRTDARRALANVSNTRKSSADAASAGPLKAKGNSAAAIAVPSLKPAATAVISRSPSHRLPLQSKFVAPSSTAPRPVASAPNLPAAAAAAAANAKPRPIRAASRHAHRIYVDEPSAPVARPASRADAATAASFVSDGSASRSASVQSGSSQTSTSSPEKLPSDATGPATAHSHRQTVDWDDEDLDEFDDEEEEEQEDDLDQDDDDEDDDDYIQIESRDATISSAIPDDTTEDDFLDRRSQAASLSGSTVNADDELVSLAPTTTVPLDVLINDRVRRELKAAKDWAIETQDDDLEEFCDYSMASEYRDDIFPYMRELEQRLSPNPQYMDRQEEIEWPMRAVLVDWLVQVHYRFALLPETLFLAINIIDRFLSVKVVSVGKLQLVGATAILVASKYEEISCPSLSDMVFMVDNGYTADEILKAERYMLSMLHFELGWPGPMSFLRRISKADDYDWETRTLAKYFLEVTIMESRFVACRPSLLAAASHCLARLMLSKGDWSVSHVYYSQYTYEQLRPLLVILVECCRKPRRHHGAVYDKYSHSRYSRASLFVEAEVRAGFGLPPVVSLTLSVPTRQTIIGSSASVPVTPSDENAPPSAVSTVSVQSCLSSAQSDSAFYSASSQSVHTGDRKRRR